MKREKRGKRKRKATGKGPAFERKICKRLSRFIDPKGKDTIFWRTAISGGRATIQLKQGTINKNQAGDITCIDPKGKWLTDGWLLECKHWADLDLTQGILFGRGKLAKFWRKVRKQARRIEKSPILIARQNHVPTLVLFDAGGLHRFQAMGYKFPRLALSEAIGKTPAFIYLFTDVFGDRR